MRSTAGRGTFLVPGSGRGAFVPQRMTTGPVPTVGHQVADDEGPTTRTTLDATVRRANRTREQQTTR